MPVTYAPVPLLATAGTFFAAGLTLMAHVENGAFEPVDLGDYSGFRFESGPVAVTQNDQEGEGGLTVIDATAGEIDVRLSAADLAQFVLKEGLDFTVFDWRLTAVYDGDDSPSEIGAGLLRVRP
ncbi:hypothetical protein ABI_21950 [Asticcacaulis biprosthecium C19]|uniref:Uncharacterized protein n=1 Tax=Asticcacaulis biprosthecium C19 TaxID=715226 RepID=F4QH00_9CAUL|nr:hypothetical protein [Asticcacaulis biprosthecium]EGF93753.1 hypothetical protein ABI_21950 [Asticcacaulis biprosthecium C19]